MQMETKPVSIYEMPDGKKMIRVKTLDEDFLLDPKHINNGRWYQFNDAMECLKEIGLTTFNKKQALLMAAYHDEINKAIEVLNGDKLNWEWSVSEGSNYTAWSYGGYNGSVNLYDKYNKSKVRPVYAVQKRK